MSVFNEKQLIQMLSGTIESCKKHPSRIALVEDKGAYTYKQLVDAAFDVRAAILKTKDSSPFVGIYTDNNFYTYASLLGILLSGKGFVPLNRKFPDDRLAGIIKSADLTFVIGCQGFQERFARFNSGIKFIIADKLEKSTAVFLDEVRVVPEAFAYILFTSGSTGIPKGIPISFHNFECLLKSLKNRFQLSAEDKVLQAFELSFDVSLACTFMAWENAATLILVNLDTIVAVEAFRKIVDEKVTVVTLPPSAVFYLQKLKILNSFKCPWIKITLFTGEALSFSQVKVWKASAVNSAIENAYGPTESTVWCLFYRLEEDSEAQQVNGLCPIGEPLNGISCKLFNKQPYGVNEEIGELLIAGKQVFSAYWKNEQKTKDVFQVDENHVKWYKTGDLVIRNKHGNFTYVNRIDNQVQVNGYRVEPGEVEYAIKNVSGIESVVVLARQENNVTELYGFIEGEFDKNKVMEGLKKSIPFYMIPRDLIRIKSLPLNANGKIDKLHLKEVYLK